MVIKLYISRVSGSIDIKKKQDFIASVMKAKKIPFEEVDISDATNTDEKNFMKENGKGSGDKQVLPPQIFNNSQYCGDYDAFHQANEIDEVKKFLKIED